VPRAYGMLKEKLEDERGRLVEEVEKLGRREEERPGYGNHMADDATGVFEQTRNLALRGSLEDTLKRVEGALERFDDGTYGTCEDCGRVIEWGRLKVLPYTSLCVECVRRHERES
jgi:RNA polymerase-binding transcription factor DksA